MTLRHRIRWEHALTVWLVALRRLPLRHGKEKSPACRKAGPWHRRATRSGRVLPSGQPMALTVEAPL